MEVQSEIYEEGVFRNTDALPNKNSLLILQFSCAKSTSEENIKEDEDGDLVVRRKKYHTIEVECSRSTPLELVGLQLWRGAYLLADFILSEKSMFEGKVILELGSGIGFTSIVAGIHAKQVICTDLEAGGILDLIRRNIKRNSKLAKAEFSVLPLDFYADNFSRELTEKLKSVDVILAADVIYDNDLTEAFINTVIRLLDSPGRKKFYLAVEKRYVFTVADLDTVAPCYEHFLSIFLRRSRRSPMAAWRIREVPLDFAQSFKYERSKHLVLWEIAT